MKIQLYRQKGVILLTIILVLVVGSSYVLISSLNQAANPISRQIRTADKLGLAKEALLFYAMNYPELRNSTEKGPGFLPCPDTDNDGAPNNCGNAVTALERTGRLPFTILGLTDLRDHTGERLWYAVSDNFKNTLSNDTVMNSDRRGLLSVDGTADIVAVVIAPGGPLVGQTTRVSNLAADYLDNVNGITNDGLFVTTSVAPFNDQLVTITRQELMAYVERRVINEARSVLSQYNTTYGAYPWLAPFADPKSNHRALKGKHDGANNSATLIDGSNLFLDWGVAIGETVWNITDGSVGIVTAVTASTVTIGGGMTMGAENDFDDDDIYYIGVNTLVNNFVGAATAGSNATTLEDTTKDFIALGVSEGDVVDNLANGDSGVITNVTATTVTVLNLLPGGNTFAAGNQYRIRTNTGIATADTDGNGLTLDDLNKNFTVMGVVVGDMIMNLTDGSVGTITNVAANRLTVAALTQGTNNVFALNDNYVLPRFIGTANIREGLLPVHEIGGMYQSGFVFSWNTATNTTIAQPTAGTHADYNDGLEAWVETSAYVGGSLTITANNSRCQWLDVSIINCQGEFTDNNFYSGTATAGTTALTVNDASATFLDAGVKRGDLVENTTDGDWGIAYNVTATSVSMQTISDGNPNINFAVGENYRIHIGSATVINEPANNPSGCGACLQNNRAYLDSNAGVTIGDTIINDQINAVGRVTGLGTDGNGDYVEHTLPLQGGTCGGCVDIWNGEPVRIISGFVSRREYTVNPRYPGTTNVAGANGIRQRDICLGYDAACLNITGNVALPGDGVTPTITINDFDGGNTLVGSVTNTIPAAGATGTLLVSGVNYQLDNSTVNNGFPDWFMDNNWHHYIYTGISNDHVSGGGQSCTAGLDCLTLQSPNTNQNDRQAIVLSAGIQIDASQNRQNARLLDYFEGTNNITADDIFANLDISATANDQIITITP